MKTMPSLKRATLPPASRLFWFTIVSAVFGFIAPISGDDLTRQQTQDDAAIESRLKQTVEYLASDELQGRGPGTDGIDRAADYIAKRMSKIGLKTDLFQGSPYQYFYARVMNYENGIRFNFVWPNTWSFIGIRIYELFLKVDDSPTNNDAFEKAPSIEGGLVKLKNVIGVLEAQGPSAEETIVIGAHYDHLGVRKNPNGETLVYHGANDNASGVSVMLEAAEILANREKKLPRRIVFVAFSGEESGLLGSFHYVDHPAVPLEKTIAMINLDVVGRMEGDTVISIGTSTSPVFPKMIDKVVKQHQLTLLEFPGAFAGSDHVAFYSRRIPVIFLLTHGGSGDMHRPTDTANTLNYTGMRKIAQIAADLAVELAEADQRPQFSEEGASSILLRNAIRLWSSFSDN